MDPFIGEIRMFAGNFAPNGWAFCNGQLLPINQYTALFSLLGTNFGGDGKSTFGLPNLQGQAPLAAGQGAGLSQRVLGERGGEPAVTLLENQMPAHTHPINCTSNPGTANSIQGGVWATAAGGGQTAYASTQGAPAAQLAGQAVQAVGNNAPHNNMPPYLSVTFIIALVGIFPSRP